MTPSPPPEAPSGPPPEAPSGPQPEASAGPQAVSYRLFQGDCLSLLRSLPDGCIDMVLTDPPYRTTNLQFDRLKIDWATWWGQIHRVTTPTAVIAVFAAQPFTTDLINSNRKNFRYDLCWRKTHSVGFLSANVRPLRAHESILIFCRRPGRMNRTGDGPWSVYNPQFTDGQPYTHQYRDRPETHYSAQRKLPDRHNDGRRHPTSVLTYGRDLPSEHPTQKPLAMCRWLVRSYSEPGQTVLDTFAGAGSCPLAAVLEGRNALAAELDAAHVCTNRRRMERLGRSDALTVIESLP